MTTPTLPNLHSHLQSINYHTGRPRFHFEEATGGGDGGAAAAAAAAAAAGGAKAWHEGKVDAETLGFWQNKGYDVTDPVKVASELTKQYRAAEKFIGVPPDQVVKMPKADAPPEDLRAFYERLGAPKEAKDYDLSAVKDTAIAEALRNTAHTAGLSKDAAAAVATALARAIESKATSDGTVNAQKLADQKTALKANWGDKFEFNQLTAMEGARKLGISKEAVAALETQIGYDGVMEAMRKIGANTREDTFVERGVNNTGEVTTREGAMARKSELMGDQAWSKKYLAGDPAAVREMTRINTMIDGEG